MAERPLLAVVPREAGSEPPAAVVDERTSPHGAGTPPPGPTNRRREGPQWSVAAAVVRVVVVVLVSGLGALALGPRLVRSDLPTDPLLLGTAARGVVVADRDYALVDNGATDEQRRASSADALPIWDLDDVRAQRDAQIVQKAVVRTAVALETLRRAQPEGKSTDTPPAAARVALDEVRAVVAGELAAADLEAPRDEQWRALLTVLWQAPGAADALGAVVSAAFMDPVLQTPPGGPIDDSEQLRVRGVRSREEQTVDIADVATVAAAQQRFEDRLQAAVVDVAPPTMPSSWTANMRQLAAWLGTLIAPNLTWNAAETEARRRLAAERVPPTIVRAWRGETVLRPGEVITARHQLLARAMAVQQADELRTRATLGTAFFVALVCSVVYLFGARRVFQRRLRTRDILMLGVLLSIELGLLVIADVASPYVAGIPGAQATMLAFALPVAFGPMCVRLTLPPDVALLFALVVALLGGVVVEGGMQWAVVATLSSMTGVAVVTGGPRRWTVLLAGAAAGLVGAFAALTLELFRGALSGSELGALLVACLIGGVLSGIVAVICVPVVERLFGYVTDQRLYRLADLNNPLLKDLIVHAPGTWHHSVRVAVLAEHAAVAVGANALLARVMSLYHDIGKISQPRSFRENQQGSDNPHDRFSPEESAAVLRGHVEEGLALAREHHLPSAVAVVIEEHHADSVMETFLQKAVNRARQGGDASDVDDRLFRYTGRPPQTKESALVMLADQIESAARNLDDDDVSPARLARVVDHFVNRALTTDLLASCDLSLKELERARAALKTALNELSRARSHLNQTEPPRRGDH